MSQPSFEDITEQAETPAAMWHRRFVAFHENNRHVFEAFEMVARKYRARGFKKVSARFILRYVSYEISEPIKQGREPFRINDRFAERYARLLIDTDSSFKGFFEFRSDKSKKGAA